MLPWQREKIPPLAPTTDQTVPETDIGDIGWTGLKLGTLGAGAYGLWNYKFTIDPRKLHYLSHQFAALNKPWWEVVGLSRIKTSSPHSIKVQAEGKWFALNFLKSIEESYFQFPRTFSLYPTFFDIATKGSSMEMSFDRTYVRKNWKYLDVATGGKLTKNAKDFGIVLAKETEESAHSSLFEIMEDGTRGKKLIDKVSIMPTFWSGASDPKLKIASDAPHRVRLAQAVQEMAGVYADYDPDMPFLIRNAESTWGNLKELAGGILHDTSSKYFRLLDDPIEGFFELLMPGEGTEYAQGELAQMKAKHPLFGKIYSGYETFFKNKFGIGGINQYEGSLTKLWLEHGKRLAKTGLYGAAAYYGLNALTSSITGFTPAQIVGTAAKTAELSVAAISDSSGLTTVHDATQYLAPGSASSPLTTFGVSLGFGLAAGIGESFWHKLSLPKSEMLWSREFTEVPMPKVIENTIGKLPIFGSLFTGNTTPFKRAFKLGSLAGIGLMLPFIPGQLGSFGHFHEKLLEAEGLKDTEVKRGRWWELGSSPFEGSDPEVFRPNWYHLLMTDARDKSIYGSRHDEPIGNFLKGLIDPYWVEKSHYFDRPYPYAASSTSGFGVFGSLYDITLGRITKPTVYMHKDEWTTEDGGILNIEDPSRTRATDEGDYGPTEPYTPQHLRSSIGNILYRTSESLGLRGFIFNNLMGGNDFLPDAPIMQNASEIDSFTREYYEQRIGGGFTTCFPPDATVLTKGRVKQIKDVEIGEEIWSWGEWKVIKDKIKRKKFGRILKIYGSPNYDIKLEPTENHWIPIIRKIDKSGPFCEDNIEHLEVQASEIKIGDYLLVPINNDNDYGFDLPPKNSQSNYPKDADWCRDLQVGNKPSTNSGIQYAASMFALGMILSAADRFHINYKKADILKRYPLPEEDLPERFWKMFNHLNELSENSFRVKKYVMPGDVRSKWIVFKGTNSIGKILFKIFFSKDRKQDKNFFQFLSLNKKTLAFILAGIFYMSNTYEALSGLDIAAIRAMLLKLGIESKSFLPNGEEHIRRTTTSYKTRMSKLSISEEDRQYLLDLTSFKNFYSVKFKEMRDHYDMPFPFYKGLYLVPVSRIEEPIHFHEEVYDLTIEDLHYYTVCSVLVHNTEALRRILPRKSHLQEDFNPIRNTMPSWLAGSNPYKNWGFGDPYSKMLSGDVLLPGEGMETLYPELNGLDPEEYPDIFKMKVLSMASPYSPEYARAKKSVERQISEGELEDKYVYMYDQIKQQVEAKERGREFAEPASNPIGWYWEKIRDTGRMLPSEYLTPFQAFHKFGGPTTAEQAYIEEKLIGKQSASWTSPISDFFGQSLMHSMYNMGAIDMSPSNYEKENIEAYFDSIEYLKARMANDPTAANKTLVGGPAYSGTVQTSKIFGPKEYAFIREFAKEDDPDDQEDLLAMMAPAQRRFLEAEYQRKNLDEIAQKIKAGQISRGEAQEIGSELNSDAARYLYKKAGLKTLESKSKIAAQQDADYKALQAITQMGAPPKDWVGWDKDVNSEDVKIRFVENQGYDMHDFNLWETRSRTLRRKPAAISAEDILSDSNPSFSTGGMTDLFSSSGFGHNVSIRPSGISLDGDFVVVNANVDMRSDIDKNMRREGF